MAAACVGARRALVVGLVFLARFFPAPLSAAPGAGQAAPDLAPVRPTAEAAQRMLDEIRQAGIPGAYYLELELHVLPRRGAERVLRARLWGSRNDEGAILRLAVTDQAGHETRFLLQNGPHAAAWRFAAGTITPLTVQETFTPLVAGLEITPFDLETPYLYWPNYTLEGATRVSGRPTQRFLFHPPAAFATQFTQLGAVRAYLDDQFHAAVQTELLAPGGAVLKTLSLVDAVRVGEQWMVKSLDVRNEQTRDKTRLQVTAAALHLDFAASLFEPATLADDVKPPAPERLERLAP